MKNINKILAVSVIAMAAVSAANAKIVSESMLGTAGHYGTGTDQVTVQDEIDTKLDKTLSTNKGGVLTTNATTGAVEVSSTIAQSKVDGLGDSLAGKQDKLASGSIVAGTNTGNVVTSISAANGQITVNKAAGSIKDEDISSTAADAITGTKVKAASSNARGTVQLAADSQNSTQVNTTAENVSNKVTSTSPTSTQKSSITMYPSMATANALAESRQAKLSGTEGNVVLYGATDGTTGSMAVHKRNYTGSDTTINSENAEIPSVAYAREIATGVAGNYVTLNQGTDTDKVLITDDSGMVEANLIENKHVADTAGITTNKIGTLTNYSKGSSSAALATTDTLNQALGKLENQAAAKQPKLSGGTGYQGKVVTAGASNGAVTYTAVSSDAASSTTGTSLMTEAAVAKTINALDLSNTYQAKGNYVKTDNEAQTVQGTKTFSGTVDVTGTLKNTGVATAAGKASDRTTAVAAVSDGNVKSAINALESKKEEYANKVTSVSSTSTDAQYPTAKAVYTAVSGVEGKLDDGANGYDIDAKSLKVQGTSVLTSLNGAVLTSNSAQTVQGTKTFSGTVDVTGTLKNTGVATAAGKASDGTTAVAAVSDGNVKSAINALESKKEEYANKVTSVSSTSTDAQYPTAKAVYTAVTNATTPAASTTVAGKIEIATVDEAKTGTATNLAITPEILHKFVGTVSGTGNSLSSDGHYVLTADVTNGVATYYWEDIGR